MKKIFLVSVWTYTTRTRPIELEQHYFAVRATGYRAAQNAAARKFKGEGYDVDGCCVERDAYGKAITAANAEELKTIAAAIRARIANYESDIDATNRLTDSELAELSYTDMARRLLNNYGLKVAKKKLAALEYFK